MQSPFFLYTIYSSLITSVLSELAKSAEATIILSILFAYSASTTAEAALVALKGRRVEGDVLASGGASVNTWVVRAARERLREEDVRLVLQKRLPPAMAA
jgi:hydrogenase maturation factor HypF (carbamoyltransferase family)